MSLTTVDQKQEQIIEAALKRFAHFGISKTTMAEIADDLSISKASLYYYFPDKTSLVIAVGEQIFSDFISAQQHVLDKSTDFEEGLIEVLDVRLAFGQKYYMMHIGDGQSDINTNDPRFKLLLNDLKSKEHQSIAHHISKYQEKGILKEIDSEETAHVFLEMLIGIWIFQTHVNNKGLFPSSDIFEDIKIKSKRIVSIFCDGIKGN